MDMEQLKANIHAQFGGALPTILREYLEAVYTDGDIEDQRKALYMGFEVLGMRSREKQENLPVVNVVFNGVSAAISLDVTPPLPKVEALKVETAKIKPKAPVSSELTDRLDKYLEGCND